MLLILINQPVYFLYAPLSADLGFKFTASCTTFSD